MKNVIIEYARCSLTNKNKLYDIVKKTLYNNPWCYHKILLSDFNYDYTKIKVITEDALFNHSRLILDFDDHNQRLNNMLSDKLMMEYSELNINIYKTYTIDYLEKIMFDIDTYENSGVHLGIKLRCDIHQIKYYENTLLDLYKNNRMIIENSNNKHFICVNGEQHSLKKILIK